MPSLHFLLSRHSDDESEDHGTIMSDFTKHQSTTSSSTHGDSASSSGHSMGGMTFHATTTDALFSTSWAPSTTGQYAGTIIFLLVLGFTYRFLAAYQSVLEHRWEQEEKGRKSLIAGNTGSQDSIIDSPKTQALARQSGVQAGLWGGKSWRWSVDGPRSGLAVVSAGVGYLL